MATITGLHHVTVNSGDPQENLDFYVGVLGMRLVKRTVNQDAPDTYHLFYADGAGTPGTELTFFPWRGMPRGPRRRRRDRRGALAVPPGTLGLGGRPPRRARRRAGRALVRFGEPALAFADPHGLALALVETADPRESRRGAGRPVPADAPGPRLHAVRLTEGALEPTERFLREGLGFAPSPPSRAGTLRRRRRRSGRPRP
jgi:glyoxalase family protein